MISMRLLCNNHGPPNPNRTKYTYVLEVEPVGYPETAITCNRGGKYNCDRPARAYLNREEDEAQAYHDGTRVFQIGGRGEGVRLTDTYRRL